MTNDKVVDMNRFEFGQRLMMAKGEESARSLARRAGISQTAMTQYLNGRSEPTRPVIAALAQAIGVRVEWLMTGEKPMRGPGVAELAADFKHEIGASNVVLIPFYEEITASAGGGALVEVENSKPVAFSNQWLRDSLHLNPPDLGLMRCKGDSMAPTIQDGDLLMFDISEEGREVADGIYIVRLDRSILVKRLQRAPGHRATIISDNPNYSPYTIDLRKDTDFAVVGRVVFKFSRV